jgi:hypothetical protein
MLRTAYCRNSEGGDDSQLLDYHTLSLMESRLRVDWRFESNVPLSSWKDWWFYPLDTIVALFTSQLPELRTPSFIFLTFVKRYQNRSPSILDRLLSSPKT